MTVTADALIATAAAMPARPMALSTPVPGSARLRGVAPMRTDAPEGNVHDRASRSVLLDRIAGLLGVGVMAPTTLAAADAGDVLLVPNEALVAPANTIRASRLLGGLVPERFVSTKAIAHGLVDADAARPPRWDLGLTHLVGDAVLRGITAFSHADALRGGRRLLGDGPVRIKDTCGKAGIGQWVVRDAAELSDVLADQDWDGIAHHGIVLEENLVDTVTYSVGATAIGGASIAYWGTQSLTWDHRGREVYGGSDLRVARGDLDMLAEHDLPAGVAAAVTCAALFDRAVRQAYGEAVLTRRNYDVIEGLDARGHRRTALLEQSWRVGGASGAELLAMAALAAEPLTACVRAATVEIYADAPPPPGAVVYFAGTDPVVGPMLKYAERRA